MRRAAVIGLAALAAATPVATAASAACPQSGTRNFQRKADLPQDVEAALGFRMAERGQPFQSTDSIPPGPRLPATRFVTARQTNCRLAIRYEQGGIAHTFQTAILERRGNAWVLLRRR